MIGHAKRSNAIYLNTLKRLKNEDIKSSHSLNNVCKYIAFDLFAGPIITYDPLLFRDLRYPPGFSSSRFSFHLLTLSTFSKWISLPCLAQHTTLPNNLEISEYLSVLSYYRSCLISTTLEHLAQRAQTVASIESSSTVVCFFLRTCRPSSRRQPSFLSSFVPLIFEDKMDKKSDPLQQMITKFLENDLKSNLVNFIR